LVRSEGVSIPFNIKRLAGPAKRKVPFGPKKCISERSPQCPITLGDAPKVRYVDFTGVGQRDVSSLSRWARRRLTHEEAMVEFPDEIGKLENAFAMHWRLARAGGTNDYRMTKTVPGVTREQVGEYYLKKRSSD
jgi:hypothetical protein